MVLLMFPTPFGPDGNEMTKIDFSSLGEMNDGDLLRGFRALARREQQAEAELCA